MRLGQISRSARRLARCSNCFSSLRLVMLSNLYSRKPASNSMFSSIWESENCPGRCPRINSEGVGKSSFDKAPLTFLCFALRMPLQPKRVQTMWKSYATEGGVINSAGGISSNTNGSCRETDLETEQTQRKSAFRPKQSFRCKRSQQPGRAGISKEDSRSLEVPVVLECPIGSHGFTGVLQRCVRDARPAPNSFTSRPNGR